MHIYSPGSMQRDNLRRRKHSSRKRFSSRWCLPFREALRLIPQDAARSIYIRIVWRQFQGHAHRSLGLQN